MIKGSHCHLDLEEMTLQQFAKAQYQATPVNKFYKNVFRELKLKGITYKQREFVNVTCSYFTYWKDLFREATKYQTDLGQRPNAAQFDARETEKIRNLCPPLQPFSEYIDLIQLITYYIFRIFMLRSTKEPSEVTFGHFVWSTVSEGEFQGR